MNELMDKFIQSENWYKLLVDTVESSIIEGEFTARMALLETYHGVGHEISLASKNHQTPITELVHRVAVDAEMGERNLWYAVKFFDKFPDLALLPEGKDVSWSKVKRKYLTETKEVAEIEKAKPNAIKVALLKHVDELVRSCQHTPEGITIFIPNDLINQLT